MYETAIFFFMIYIILFFLRPEQLWILNPQKLLRKLEKKKLTHSGAEVEALVSAKDVCILKSGNAYFVTQLKSFLYS